MREVAAEAAWQCDVSDGARQINVGLHKNKLAITNVFDTMAAEI